MLPLLLLAIEVQPAHACSCASPLPPWSALQRASAVFVGTAAPVSQSALNDLRRQGRRVAGPATHRFSVKQSFKGVPGNTVVIHTGADKGNCGKTFTPGEDYLIYAYADEQGNFHTSQYTRTGSLSHAYEDLAYLGTCPAPPIGSRIKGDVERVVGYSVRSPSWAVFKHTLPVSIELEPVANVELAFTRDRDRIGPEESFAVRTDDRGEFELTGLKPGIYRARIAGEGFQIRTNERRISGAELRDGVHPVRLRESVCVESHFVRERVGSVTIRFADVEGNPIGDFPEGGLSLAPSDYIRLSPRHTRPTSPGIFRFDDVPVGRYYFAVAGRSIPNNQFPYAALREDDSLRQTATVVRVTPDQPDQHLELRLKRLEPITISGVVAWPDDVGAKSSGVFYERPGIGFFELVSKRYPTGAEFRFEWFRGLKVYLHAEGGGPRRYARSEPVSIMAAGDTELNFVLNVPAKLTDSSPTHSH
jgi:hypothetical protein